MKKQYRNYSTVCCLFLWLLLLSVLSPGHAGSIREEMAGIPTVDSLEQYYYQNRGDLYKKRYILKYTPKFLEESGVTSVPRWVSDAINESLDSDYDALVEEAVIAAGKLELAEFTGKIIDIFKKAPQKFSAYSSILRTFSVGAIMKIGGDYARAAVPEILGAVSREGVSQPEFGTVLRMAQKYGDETIIDSLQNFKVYAENRVSSISEEDDNRQIRSKYENIASALTVVIGAINEREVAHE